MAGAAFTAAIASGADLQAALAPAFTFLVAAAALTAALTALLPQERT